MEADRNIPKEERNHGAHIEPMPVPQLCPRASLVQINKVEVASAHDPVVDQHDAAGRAEERRVAG